MVLSFYACADPSSPKVKKAFLHDQPDWAEYENLTAYKNKNTENKDLCFHILRHCIYHCWHFNIYEHDKFHAQLSMKKFYKLGFLCAIYLFYKWGPVASRGVRTSIPNS